MQRGGDTNALWTDLPLYAESMPADTEYDSMHSLGFENLMIHIRNKAIFI